MAGNTSLIIEGNFDGEMIQMFQELRLIRLEVLREQLRSSSAIASTLGASEASEKESFEEVNIRSILTEKIACIEKRLAEGNAIYADELDLFVDLLNQQ